MILLLRQLELTASGVTAEPASFISAGVRGMVQQPVRNKHE